MSYHGLYVINWNFEDRGDTVVWFGKTHNVHYERYIHLLYLRKSNNTETNHWIIETSTRMEDIDFMSLSSGYENKPEF